ncbi:MAG: thioredoxin domain-containing protein [Pirellulales bacterium]|nr:thioredoxin domain-containing protein [Pirellulales bacterium]
MPNRLAGESSPYLLQHKDNPVDWYPWGAEALERAKREGKPIFLSIGYSACHWCHVMEHESFENATIAKQINDEFVPIKVDREERPDLDQIYMNAVQMMTGRGGWPMSMFLTPDLQPFFGGTYWPPTSKHGMPGFDRVLAAVADAWRTRRKEIVEQAGQLTEQLRDIGRAEGAVGDVPDDLVERAAAELERTFDAVHGGFGQAPKFPHPMDLRVLLRAWRRLPKGDARRATLLNVVTHTLDRMAAGGIYDHLGGGFHRYSVDERWLVPHFEKMLYDNALLVPTYLEAFQATGRDDYATIARETLDYLLREMNDPAGGFYSTQDADSEGEEGKFYVWTPAELETVLGPARAKAVATFYDVSAAGNFEGHNILNRTRSFDDCAKLLGREPGELATEIDESRKLLLAARLKRVPPGLDDKVLTGWNALAIEAFAQAGAILAEPRYIEAARRAADFLLTKLRGDNGRLLHTWRAGRARFDAYLDDYAALAAALVTLYETTFDERWIDEAVMLVETMLDEFADVEAGGFFYTADNHETLIARTKDAQDSSVPSGNALAATALVRLGKLTGRGDWLDAARRTLECFARILRRAPTASGQMVLVWDELVGPTPELVFTGGNDSQRAAAAAQVWHHFLPNRALASRPAATTTQSPALAPIFEGKDVTAAEPTLYVCEDFACQAPVSGVPAIRAAVEKLATGG